MGDVSEKQLKKSSKEAICKLYVCLYTDARSLCLTVCVCVVDGCAYDRCIFIYIKTHSKIILNNWQKPEQLRVEKKSGQWRCAACGIYQRVAHVI